MTPKEALIRGGHKHPEQILADLEAGGCIVLDPDEAADYEMVRDWAEDAQEGFTLEEFLGWVFRRGYQAGLDVGKDRFS
jgi:hypothetical protein